MMSRDALVFISYASEDIGQVTNLYDGLKRRNVRVWFDKRDLKPGKWKPQITRAISQSSYFLICLSEAALRKTGSEPGFQDVELNTAFDIALAQSDQTFTIVPVRLEDVGRGDNRLSIYQQYDLFADWEGALDDLADLFGGSPLSLVSKETDERTEDQKIIAALEGKADAFYLSGYTDKALTLLHTIEELEGESFRSLSTKGAVLHTLGKFEEAVSAFDKAISLLPDDKTELSPEVAVVFKNRGNALRDFERYKEALNAYRESLPNPTKAIPVSPSELEKIQRDFRFNSPVPKYATAPLPKAGEVWKLERTLPSGLVLLRGDSFSFIDDIKELIRTKLFGEKIDSDFDERPFLYDVERFKSEDPLRSIQLRNTWSVSWHPKLQLLATAGDGNIVRVWDVNGEAITKRAAWHTASPGNTLSWSSGGELFISGEDIFDGNTGEYLCGSAAPWTTHFRYSSHTYEWLRGCHSHSNHNTSHLSSTNNFSPWRPNSRQLIFGEYEQYLILRDGRTNKIEKVIDCDVSSNITDFAWHPKGRFIAVTFDEHNIRIIAIDEAKIIDDLSVQHLLGWNPDGKILVARKEKGKDDFVIWDALETREKPMPEEMKNELWFKRFFKNISADGLRYIKYECDENHNCSTNIYSVASDELVATLPKPVATAAWSPIDGGLLATCGGSETRIWKI